MGITLLARGGFLLWAGLLAGLLAVGCTPGAGSGAPAASAPAPASSAAAPANAATVDRPSAAPTTSVAPAAPATLAHATPTIGFTTWPTMVGEAKGFFAARGIALDRSITPRIPDIVRALAAGSLQVGAFIPDSALIAAAQGAPLALVGVETGRPVYQLAVQPSVASFGDLRGKTFAVGATNDLTAGMLRRVLRLNGLAPTDYDLVSAGSTPERYAALTSGQVAGVLLIPPLDLRAEREGYRLLADLVEVLPPFPANGLVVNRTWAEANRPVAARWLAAMGDSARWLNDPANKDEAIRILAEQSKVSDEDASATYAVVVEKAHAFPADLRVTEAHLQAVLDLMQESGSEVTAVPDRFLDGSYLDEAQRLPAASPR